MSSRTITSHFIRGAAIAVVLAAVSVTTADAQSPDLMGSRNVNAAFEIRPYAGAYIPTGDQRDLLEDALLAGAQASWRITPMFAVTGTFGWTPSKDRVRPGDETLDLYQYDLGGEVRVPAWYGGGSWELTPFVGLGIGARTYDYRDLDDVDSKTNVAGFAAVGGEVGFGRFGFRVEARDYVSRFEALSGNEDAKTRNDVTVAAGFTVRF